MRVLIVHPGPHFSVHDVYQGWLEALGDLGVDVFEYNLNARLVFYASALLKVPQDEAEGTLVADDAGAEIAKVRRAWTDEEAIGLAANGILSACYQVWPDVVLLISAFFTPALLLEVMRARKHKLVFLHTECPYQDHDQLLRAAYADLNLVNDPVSLPAFRELGMPAEYMPHAYRPKVHCPGPGDPGLFCDFAFSGTGFGSRIEFFEAMDFEGLDVVLAGNWQQLSAESPLRKYLAHEPDECLDNDQTALLYRSARTGLNFYRREAETLEQAMTGSAMGPREVEMAATGLWFMRDPRPESDQTFPMLPAFDGPGEASDLLRWALAHPGECAAAAAAARTAIAGRTFDNHARQLLRLLDT